MRTPSSALPAWPNGLVEGLLVKVLGSPFGTAAFAFGAGFFALSLTTFLLTTFLAAGLDLGLTFVLAFVLALTFLRFAIVVPSRNSIDVADLFLAKHALRVEVADAAALAAGCRIDHRVDEGRLAGVHGLVDGATQLVGCRHMHADAAERFDDFVVARVFDEGRGRGIRTAGGIEVGSAIDAVVVED